MRTPLISGDEQDALTKDRRRHNWRAGEIKAIKRRYARRVRHQGRQAARDGREA